MKIVTLFILIVLGFPSFGGGDIYLVTIESLEINNGEFSIKFKVPSPGWYEDQCTIVNVSGKYESEKWRRYNGEKINFKFHEDVIEVISKAYKENQRIMFGAFDEGLHKVTKCKYLSKGLFAQGDYIFSIYGNI